MREHLSSCGSCQAALEQLTAIRDTAFAFEELEPSEATWYAIRRRVAEKSQPRWAWIWTGVAATAATVLVVLLAGVNPSGGKGGVPDEFARETPDRPEVTEELATAYGSYMRGIDDALMEIRTAMAENPGNPRVRMAYHNARSSKVRALDRLCSGGY